MKSLSLNKTEKLLDMIMGVHSFQKKICEERKSLDLENENDLSTHQKLTTESIICSKVSLLLNELIAKQ